MAYEVTALVTFYVQERSEAKARRVVDDLDGDELSDKLQVIAVQIHRVDRQQAKPVDP